MSYTSGTISSSSTPVEDMMDVLRNELGNHSAWAFIEDNKQSSSDTNYIEIWKNDGSLNSWGSDFYIGFEIQQDYEDIYTYAMEEWDSSAKEAVRGAMDENDTNDIGSNAACPKTVPFNNFSSDLCNIKAEVNTTSFQYFVQITNDTLVWGTDSNMLHYVGLYDSFIDTNSNEFPLIVGELHVENFAHAISRVPNLENTTGASYAFASGTLRWTTDRYAGRIPDYKNVFLDAPVGSRVALNGAYSSRRSFKGLLKDNVLFFDTESNVNIGDTVDIDGSTWVYVGGPCWIDTTV